MHQIQSVSIDGSSTTLDTADDSTELFKAQVAARIGREPHEILLKRQGERPFKDQLTLEDYGVSNGVQLDLSVPFSNHLIQQNTNNLSGKSIQAIDHFMHDRPRPSCLEHSCIYRHGVQKWGLNTMIPKLFFSARNRC